jgi:hypothetical protein
LTARRTAVIVDAPGFKEGGPKRHILRTCSASLIIHHRHVTHDMGLSNAITSQMHKASRNVTLQDPRFPAVTPEAVLDEWSKLVESNFKARTIDVSPISQSIDAKMDTMMKMMKMMKLVVATVTDLKTHNVANVLTMADQMAQIVVLQTEA